MADHAITDIAFLRFELHDYWHSSAGQAVRAGLNATVVRKDGLPYIPGRTVKGLLREALTQAEGFGAVPEGATEWLCGVSTKPVPQTVRDLAEDRFGTEAAALVVDDAALPSDWMLWARTDEGRAMLEDIGMVLHTTAIDREGQVIDKTLRSIEVMPPMRLHAPLALMPQVGCVPGWAKDVGWHKVIRTAVPLLRAVGSRRNRGLGRATVTLVPAVEGSNE